MTTNNLAHLLASYQNGNCATWLYTDGTKVRTVDGEPRPVHPESIDLKITDYCDAGCSFCHEQSTKRGKHADLNAILGVVDGLPHGVEIAIGGGNPLSYPRLMPLLTALRARGLVANLTVNEVHFPHQLHNLIALQNQGYLHGIGVSVKDVSVHDIWRQIMPMPRNLVYHVIVGIADPQALLRSGKEIERILVLGYKRYGFGKKCKEGKLQEEIARWRYWIGTIMRKVPHVSFDNLAIEQLGVKDMLEPETWRKHYMGDDGQFTMYVDAVREEFAVSSTSQRRPIAGKTIIEMFAEVSQGEKNCLPA